MGKAIFDCVVVPVADEDDARTTCHTLAPYLDVVDDISCSVLLAEKARTRTFKERLFGR